jgi:hypothetical protein
MIKAPSHRLAGWRVIVQAWLPFCLALLPLFALPPPAQGKGTLAAVFPPWWPMERAFAAAAAVAPVRGTGALASVVLVMARGEGTAAALSRAGAWLVVDGRWAGGCRPIAAQGETGS